GERLGRAVADVGADHVVDHLVARLGGLERGVFAEQFLGDLDAADGAAGDLPDVIPAAGEHAGVHPGFGGVVKAGGVVAVVDRLAHLGDDGAGVGAVGELG